MKQGTEYELFVQEIYRNLNSVDGLNNVEIQHDVILPGTARNHQIDVFWQFSAGGVSYKVAVECKDHKRPVSAEMIESFYSVLQDIGGIIGIYATKTGFQSGAIAFAKIHGIELMEIRKPTDKDWEGKVRYVNFRIEARTIGNVKPGFIVDKDWADQQGIGDLPTGLHEFSDRVYISEYNDEDELVSKTAMSDIINTMPRDEVGFDFIYQQMYDNAYLECKELRYKIKGIMIKYDILSSSEEHEIDGARSIKSIVKNIISGDKKIIDIHGNVRPMK